MNRFWPPPKAQLPEDSPEFSAQGKRPQSQIISGVIAVRDADFHREKRVNFLFPVSPGSKGQIENPVRSSN